MEAVSTNMKDANKKLWIEESEKELTSFLNAEKMNNDLFAVDEESAKKILPDFLDFGEMHNLLTYIIEPLDGILHDSFSGYLHEMERLFASQYSEDSGGNYEAGLSRAEVVRIINYAINKYLCKVKNLDNAFMESIVVEGFKGKGSNLYVN